MNPYSVLGVEKNISQNELKQIYRKLVLQHHPDKGGDAKIFSDIREAYIQIKQTNKPTDDNKTTYQQRYSTIDVLKSFLYTQINKEFKDLYLTLDEMYTGKIIQINLTKFVHCRECSSIICKTCNGLGKIHNSVNMFGISQTISTKCTACFGDGFTRVCSECDGSGELPENTIYKLKIKKGCQDGDKYGVENNSIVFVIKQTKHPRFMRNENDLILYKSISLFEALTCTKVTCKHLNSKNYIFRTDKTIQNDSIYKLPNLGMPNKKTNEYGNLYIKFNIILPDKHFSEKEKMKLKPILDVNSIFTNVKDNIGYCEKVMLQSNEDMLDKNLVRFIRLNIC